MEAASPATHRAGTPVVKARSRSRFASVSLVANRTPAGTPASARRAGSCAQARGRCRARSTKAVPVAEAEARNTPTWALAVPPTAPASWVPTPQDVAPFLTNAVSSTMSTPLAASPRVLHDVGAQVVPHPLRVPGGRVEQALHALRPGLAQGLRQLPPVLALHPAQQPRQVAPRPRPHLRAGEAAGQARVQRRQARLPPDHRARHTPRPLHHHGDLASRRGRTAYRQVNRCVAIGGIIVRSGGRARRPRPRPARRDGDERDGVPLLQEAGDPPVPRQVQGLVDPQVVTCVAVVGRRRASRSPRGSGRSAR